MKVKNPFRNLHNQNFFQDIEMKCDMNEGKIYLSNFSDISKFEFYMKSGKICFTEEIEKSP